MLLAFLIYQKHVTYPDHLVFLLLDLITQLYQVTINYEAPIYVTFCVLLIPLSHVQNSPQHFVLKYRWSERLSVALLFCKILKRLA